ncbi:MAG: hypothetical protein M5R36_04375 [Deltaproteobacteria bacterium]|nr:hypothetical protein [Deltaproteobacteria bacterium]
MSRSNSCITRRCFPEVVIGRPAPPRMPWTIFHDIEAYGQSGILPEEDEGISGMLNRVRFPTPFRLFPNTYKINPGVPTLFPEMALADLFIGEATIPSIVMNYMNFETGRARATLTNPDGRVVDLGEKGFRSHDNGGPVLEDGGFAVDLTGTGEYELQLTGRKCTDYFGREYEGGGTYRFTVAYPLTFSTPVKPGTNYFVGSRYPASASVNPAVPAETQIEITFYPNSDPDRARTEVFSGRANRFGHFMAHGKPPMLFDEPGEYRSLLTTRYIDGRGRLWYGAQTSAGVISPYESDVALHGGRTYISPPSVNTSEPHYGGRARYETNTEGGSSTFEPETYCQFDYIFPYHSGDTLNIATTYPFESVVGIVLSMEAKTKELARRLVRSYNPDNQRYDFPITPRKRKPIFLPDAFKWSEDNFGYYRISEDHADHLPILWSNKRGISPWSFPVQNDIEAYTYLSVIRPGFPVMSLAFAGSFMGPCWIVAPNPYGGQINSGKNGDLPGDVYRIMAGLVLKDKETGKNYYDIYSAAISTLAPGSFNNSVSAPGVHDIRWNNGRHHKLFIGMDTSQSYLVGEKMMLGGTVMPPTTANVTFTVTKPDGTEESLSGTSSPIGGFSPLRPIPVDQAGVYKVKGIVEKDGATGDIPGTGDGSFYHFAIPPDHPEFMQIGLPPYSRVPSGDSVHVPLRWPDDVENATLTWSIMMPGSVLDEGQKAVRGHELDFKITPAQLAIQYPFIDTVDYANGNPMAVDTIVLVFFLEGERGGEKVYDLARVILRGETLYNPRAIFAETGPPVSVGKPRY